MFVATAPEPGAIGLRSFEVMLPDSAELGRVVGRVEAAGLPTEPHDEEVGWVLTPDGLTELDP